MNEGHQLFCSSPEWMEYMRDTVLPGVLAGVDLGEDMLELGPGAGAATPVLAEKVQRLTALEVDAGAAASLANRFEGTNVTVVHGDCTRAGLPDESFDSIGCFTMLHHVPTGPEQHRLLAEALRMLRPGGLLVGSDSIASSDLHDFHAGDVYNPVEPASLLTQLMALGFHPVSITVRDELTFTARKP